MHSHRLSTLLVATIVSGCASASGSTGAETPAPTRPPVLVDCADFNSPETDLSRQFVDVVVPVRVNSSGAVTQAGAPRASRQQATQQVLDRARSLARSCSFEPATSEGKPVAARTEVRFRLGIG